MIRTVGALVGRADAGAALAADSSADWTRFARAPARFPRRPRVFFEEWDDPLISGICWVDELVEIAGGTPCFPELRGARLAKDRILDPQTVADGIPK